MKDFTDSLIEEYATQISAKKTQRARGVAKRQLKESLQSVSSKLTDKELNAVISDIFTYFRDSGECWCQDQLGEIVADISANEIIDLDKGVNYMLSVLKDDLCSDEYKEVEAEVNELYRNRLSAADVSEIFSGLQDSLTSKDRIHLRKGRASLDPAPTKHDAWTELDICMNKCHYDNGLPLTGKNYPSENPTKYSSYFDHYDRDQDYFSFFDGCEVAGYFFEKDGSIGIILDLTPSELLRYVRKEYDGAKYAHDFGK